jgi:protein phosphatase
MWKDDPTACVGHLIEAANTAGGPDNITVIVLDVGGEEGEARSDFVGSAASKRKFPSASSGDTGTSPRPKTRTVPVSTSELPLPTTAPKPTLGGDAEPPRLSVRARRRLRAGLIAFLVLGVLVAAAAWAYSWTQTRYYLGTSGSHVAVFQGIPVTFGGLALSHVYLESDLLVSSLPAYDRAQVTQSVPFENAPDAVNALNRMTGE